jgi:hypothetical protein
VEELMERTVISFDYIDNDDGNAIDVEGKEYLEGRD